MSNTEPVNCEVCNRVIGLASVMIGELTILTKTGQTYEFPEDRAPIVHIDCVSAFFAGLEAEVEHRLKNAGKGLAE